MNALYLWVDLAVLLPTLALSFDKRVAFYRQWRSYWPINVGVLAVFVAWDVLFTREGIWGFNPDYLVGIDVLGLPIEEWGFFVAVPYACTFTYATLKHYFPRLGGWRNGASSAWLAAWVVTAWLVTAFWGNWYTVTAAAGLWAALTWWRPSRAWMPHFWLAYAVLLVPFVVSNGVLTGIAFWEYPLVHAAPDQVLDQIVWYNNEHNTGVRICSMPADDLVYGGLLMLLHIAGLEWLEWRRMR